MKSEIFIILTTILITTTAQAETSCQIVNRTGRVVNAELLKDNVNTRLTIKNITYRTTSTEISNTVKNYCKSNPYGVDDDILNHLGTVVDVITKLK